MPRRPSTFRQRDVTCALNPRFMRHLTELQVETGLHVGRIYGEYERAIGAPLRHAASPQYERAYGRPESILAGRQVCSCPKAAREISLAMAEAAIMSAGCADSSCSSCRG
jgi:hypothetical protein